MIESFLKENIVEILDNIQEGIHIIDHTGKIIYYNTFALKLDEIDREKAIGRHILEIYPSLSHDTSTLLKVIRTGQPIYNVEQTFINYKGDKITTINSSMPLKSKGRIVGALEISRDITEVRKLSEKIVDLQKELYITENKLKPKNQGTASFTFADIIGQNTEMLRIKSLALKAAGTSSPVLIYGETGTGKELFVQSIHNASPRRSKPFIAQNCAALPSNLLEGILFGTARGGFTGAEDRPGLFEVADGGTLLLDEINSMPLDLQAKLLRVIQDGSIRRVGQVKTTLVDVRIIAATNIPPEKAIKENLLRRDLYYRLNVVSINIPELKDRPDDIPILANHFVNKYNRILGKNVNKIDSEVMNLLINFSWPGNVRELEHLIEGIMTLYDTDTIKLQHTIGTVLFGNQAEQGNYQGDDSYMGKSLKETIEQTEKTLIHKALLSTDWNITKTAEELDIPRQTLQYKIKKYKLFSI
ncbi:arginine utilization regulatory protein [Proteiniborus ethanoligenes]|uniref:Arginine utilization regulatory protein n=1 Tax=Proteiniborus ethanoligenes TaxID=415015 RepID=A0A1H3M0P6_9FIRM|nr:sigma 54-interacting transcriptional regulator [Proteiniborus ethanoligenes]SDY70281.1 arginine utilization regulatory protein [Proteiniborus ethanoligenes]